MPVSYPVAHRALEGNVLGVVLHLSSYTHPAMKEPDFTHCGGLKTLWKNRKELRNIDVKSLNTMWSIVFLAFTNISLRETFISVLLHRKLGPELGTQRNSLAIPTITIKFCIAKPCLKSRKIIKKSSSCYRRTIAETERLYQWLAYSNISLNTFYFKDFLGQAT